MSFWDTLKKPFFVLAPMADVTDAAYRRLIAKYSAHERSDGTTGGPDVMWTEFVSADGLVRANKEGKQKLLADLLYSEEERPIIAQLFSAVPEYMEEAAALCKKLGFDGVDINMGCPDRSVEKQGSGAAMIKNPKNALAVIEAAKRGAGQGEQQLPVSVKTRLGYTRDELEEWLPVLLSAGLAAITIHARTRKEMSSVPARWERVRRAVEIRDELQKSGGNNQHTTVIIGNGDLSSLEDAKEKALETGADGMMLGRAIFGNPWLFHPTIGANTVSIEEKLRVMVEHTQIFEELFCLHCSKGTIGRTDSFRESVLDPHKNFAIMKKHYKAYVTGFIGAKELRMELMEAQNADEVAAFVKRFVHGASPELLASSATLTV